MAQRDDFEDIEVTKAWQARFSRRRQFRALAEVFDNASEVRPAALQASSRKAGKIVCDAAEAGDFDSTEFGSALKKLAAHVADQLPIPETDGERTLDEDNIQGELYRRAWLMVIGAHARGTGTIIALDAENHTAEVEPTKLCYSDHWYRQPTMTVVS